MANPHYQMTQVSLERTSPGIAHGDELLERFLAYDSSVPEAEHLRPHQGEAIGAFNEHSIAMLSGREALRGMSILHPTGSGKTVTATELIRLVSGGESDINSLMLVPGHQIKGQVVGTKANEDVGAVRKFIPSMSVGEYSGRRKTLAATTTVMTYHSLGGAIERGHIDVLNPGLVVCDEIQHVIDGTWAEQVAEITSNRLLVGLTATPSYSESRDARRLFPVVLAEKTIKQGIEEGILSELKGYTYRGSSRIEITKKRGGDFAEEDVFKAIAESKDNYLAASICAAEVAQGRRGIVSCVPGQDRAHAKIMAKILSQTMVKTADGERPIRAAYVDGEMDEDVKDEILKKHRRGEIDVVTFVNLLLEGWDSPETEFSVLLRPTLSKVLAEQRLGRITRAATGKIATVHEIIYEVEDGELQQVTHIDILERERVEQGHSFSGRQTPDRRKYDSSRSISGGSFDAERFVIDSGLLKKISELDQKPMQDIRVASGQESIPFDWQTSYVIANMFDLDVATTEEILQESNVLSTTNEVEGNIHRFFAPGALSIVAEHLGMGDITEDLMTIGDVSDYCREEAYHSIRPDTVLRHLEKAGVPTVRCFSGNRVIKAYPRELAIKSVAGIVGAVTSRQSREYKIDAATPQRDVANWLARMLTNPLDAADLRTQREIRAGQGLMLRAIQKGMRVSEDDRELLEEFVAEHEIEPTEQMVNVMRAKDMSFIELLATGAHARQEYLKLFSTV
ncbi:MAG: DEAD/DEAH box helicase [Candidatus Saccharimonadales bacterium]